MEVSRPVSPFQVVLGLPDAVCLAAAGLVGLGAGLVAFVAGAGAAFFVVDLGDFGAPDFFVLAGFGVVVRDLAFAPPGVADAARSKS